MPIDPKMVASFMTHLATAFSKPKPPTGARGLQRQGVMPVLRTDFDNADWGVVKAVEGASRDDLRKDMPMVWGIPAGEAMGRYYPRTNAISLHSAKLYPWPFADRQQTLGHEVGHWAMDRGLNLSKAQLDTLEAIGRRYNRISAPGYGNDEARLRDEYIAEGFGIGASVAGANERGIFYDGYHEDYYKALDLFLKGIGPKQDSELPLARMGKQ